MKHGGYWWGDYCMWDGKRWMVGAPSPRLAALQRGITHHVVIEADNAAAANAIGERIGLYFDGTGDCPCCGNRWYSAWQDESGDDAPTVYGAPAAAFTSWQKWMEDGREICVHYLDGRKEWHGVKEKQ